MRLCIVEAQEKPVGLDFGSYACFVYDQPEFRALGIDSAVSVFGEIYRVWGVNMTRHGRVTGFRLRPLQSSDIRTRIYGEDSPDCEARDLKIYSLDHLFSLS